jgi:outer membrane protein OmpU
MNNLKKIGLSALAGSLVAVSAQAGSLSVTGAASLTFSNSDTKSHTAEGNQWTMGDSITFAGSGEMDNGMTISVSYELDGDAADTGNSNELDSHSMTLDTNGMGTITFAGHGGSSAMSAIDDTSPNAYEESWDVVNGAAAPPGGSGGNNMFTYKSPSVGGAQVTVAYLNASDAITDVSYMDYAISWSPEMVEGLTVGYGHGETEETTGTAVDDTSMYVKYTYGSVTIGYHDGESDGTASSSDIDFEAIGVTYAVTDDFTIGYHQSKQKKGSDADEQEASAIGASFTSGGITVGGSMNDIDNVGYDATNDTDGYEFNIAFAF